VALATLRVCGAQDRVPARVRAFTCPDCSSLVPFESTRCLVSDTDLGYSRRDRAMLALRDGRTADGLVRCVNAEIAACNWLTTPDRPLCDCCALTRTRPADGDTDALAAFAGTEAAKRRLLHQLDDLELPVVGRDQDPEGGLAFDLLSSVHENVVIGHASGVVTIDLAEGDDGYREQIRVRLAEPYRTMLGHFRHEIGHYYWDKLVEGSRFLEPFRAKFGDERASYADAVTVHYRDGAPKDWRDRFISSYASMHPWEDWAESWAHYLHMVDTLETARSFGLALQPKGEGGSKTADLAIKARRVSLADIDDMLAAWPALTIALNSLNRSLGLPDPYPFAPPAPALDKIRFVHEVIEASPDLTAASPTATTVERPSAA